MHSRPSTHSAALSPVRADVPRNNSARTPLTSLLLGLGLLDDGALGKLSAHQQAVVRTLLRDANRLLAHIDCHDQLNRLGVALGSSNGDGSYLFPTPAPAPLDDEHQVVTAVVQRADGSVLAVNAERFLWSASDLLRDAFQCLALPLPPLATAPELAAPAMAPSAAAPAEVAFPPARRVPVLQSIVPACPPRVAPESHTRLARPDALRVCTVVAPFTGFRTERGNTYRVGAAMEALQWAADNEVAAVAFPAGYLWSPSDREDDILQVAAPIVAVSERVRVALVLGVDACPPDWEDTTPREPSVALGALPYFAVTRPRHRATPRVFRQRSTTDTNWKLAPDQANRTFHGLEVDGTTIALLLSGEIFSRAVVSGLPQAAPGLAILAGHWTGKGVRRSRGAGAYGNVGVALVRAVHARTDAEHVLWRDGAKLPPLPGQAQFKEAGFAIRAALFDVVPTPTEPAASAPPRRRVI